MNTVNSDREAISHEENCPSSQEINEVLVLFSEGRCMEAATLTQAITVRFPLYAFGWTVLGAICNQMGQSEDALAHMQKAVTLSPDNPDVHINLGNNLRNLGRLEEAEASFLRALQIKPDR